MVLPAFPRFHRGLSSHAAPQLNPVRATPVSGLIRLFHQRQKLVGLGVVSEQFRGGDLEKPAVQTQRSVGEPFLHAGITVQVVEAEQNIFLGGGGFLFRTFEQMRIALFQGFQGRRGQVQPVAQMGRGIADRFGGEQRGDRAALGMAADDDIVDPQGFHGEFNRGGGGIRIALRAGGRDDVADVFDHEQIARFALGDEFREHARIGAGDEQGVRILSFLRQLAEELAIIAKLVLAESVDAFDERFHDEALLGERFVFGARFLGELHFEFFQGFRQRGIAHGQDLRGQDARIASAADGNRRHGNARRHLHDGQQ